MEKLISAKQGSKADLYKALYLTRCAVLCTVSRARAISRKGLRAISRADAHDTPRTMKRAVLTVLTVLSIVLTTCGCGEIKTMMEVQENLSEVKVNSGIYSNDYVLDEGPREGGSIELYATTPNTLNPLLVQNVYVREITGLVFESIANINSRLKAEYSLASGWTVSEDRLSWTIDLKANVRWHDGREFTSYDVVKTVERIREYGNESPYFGLIGNIREVRQLDKLRVLLVLEKVNSYTPETLIFPIVPAHIPLEVMDNTEAVANIEERLIGTGPYIVERYVPGNRIRLTENTEWAGRFPDQLEQPPFVGKVTFNFFDSRTSALSAFQEQKANAVFSRNIEYSRYRDSTEMQIKRYSEREFDMIAFNTDGGMTSRSVRFAISKIINRTDIVENSLKGRGVPAEIPVQPESWLYGMGGFAASVHDPESVEAILRDGGFEHDAGGYFRMSNGNKHRLELRLLVDKDNSDQVRVAEHIAETLTVQGIGVFVEAVPFETMMERVRGRDFDMALVSYRINSIPDFSVLYAQPYFEQDASMNISGYQNNEVDRLIREMYLDHDELGRQNTFAELTSILRRDCPYVGLYFKASSLVLRNDIRGLQSPNVWEPFGGIENWYIADYR